MKQKEQENEEDNVIDITTAQFFSTPDKAFLIKNNKNAEEKKFDEGNKNGHGR